jgi:hypothetical protein
MELKVGEVSIATAFLARMWRCIALTRASSTLQEQTEVVLTISCCLGKLEGMRPINSLVSRNSMCRKHVTS